MKTPRVTDFDPDAKVPTLKSSLDHMPVIEKSKPPIQEAPVSKTPQQPVQETTQKEETEKPHVPVRPYERSPVRQYARTDTPKRRHLIRHPFEFFEDQVAQLRRVTLEAQLRGEKVSMSEMVREAVDTYLKEKTRTPVR